MHGFERFSDAAKLTLTLAQEEAERAHQRHIGTEHVVLALTRDPEHIAGQVLQALGVSESGLRERLTPALAGSPAGPVERILPTSSVKKAIELAFEESTRARRREVTTGDLLVGVLAEGQALGAQVLAELGVRPADVRAELARLSVVGAVERSSGRRVRPPGPMSELRPLAEGARVLVHEPDPPHHLWEGRVVSAAAGEFEVEVAGRPAGTRMSVGADLLHPVPSGPTFLCPYCRG